MTATDYGNSVSASVMYMVLSPPVAEAGSNPAVQAALNLLAPFISEINAQREQMVANPPADTWIAQAQAIINNIVAT